MDIDETLVSQAFSTGVDTIGDAWTFLILREAFFGATRFQDFVKALNIPRARLTERLKHLVELGVFEKQTIDRSAKRYEYRMGERGLSIYPIALELIAWAEAWRRPQNAPKLIHTPCGHRLRIKTICRHCSQPVNHKNVSLPHLLPVRSSIELNSSVRSWRRMASFDDLSARPDPALETLKAFGDRWSMLTMYGALRGPFRFGEAQGLLGLAPNILSNRLKHLVNEGLLERTDPSRHASYIATVSGLALANSMFAIRTWAADTFTPSPEGWAPLIHLPCGSDLRTEVVCASCGERVLPKDVEYRFPQDVS
ncbi:MAG: helix-turn-helix domain-containing protein [Pseudomonadota bacterium]